MIQGLVHSLFIAVCNSGCINGTCNLPDTCECNDGWTGDACDEGMHVLVAVRVFLKH